jgi:mono/diheme cytochrome c family protein
MVFLVVTRGQCQAGQRYTAATFNRFGNLMQTASMGFRATSKSKWLAIAAGLLQSGAAFAQSGTDPAAPAPVSEGRQVFDSACVACHGYDGRGGYGGGVPLDQVRDVAMIYATVTDGRGNMPPLGDLLTPEQIRAVADFIVTDLFKAP